MKSTRRRAKLSLATCAGIAGLAVACQARAGTLYWDGDGTGAVGNPPTSGVGGSGQWDNSITADWYDGSAYQIWDSAAGQDIASFGGTAGTVNINSGETINVNQMNFTTGGYTVTGDSSTTLQLNNAGVINTTTGTTTITAPILGGNMDVEGAGTLLINNAINYIQGSVTVGPGSTLSVIPANNFQLGSGETLNGGTLLYSSQYNYSAGSTSTSLNVTANSTLQFNNLSASGAAGYGGSAKYYYGGLTLGANLNVDAQTNAVNFYYGMPTTYFYGGMTLTQNATLNVTGINAGATSQINTVNLFNGGITGAYTLTKAGNGNLVVGKGGNYSGLIVNGGTVTTSDTGGLPTTTLGFGGGTLYSQLAAGTTINLTTTTVTAASAFYIDQLPQSNGASTYNLGTLSLGGNLTIAENNTSSYYSGQPVIKSSSTVLTGNSTLSVTGGTAGGLIATTLGPITGAYQLTTAGNDTVNILSGGTGSYSGLAITNSGGVQINSANGLPTATLAMNGTGPLTLYAPTGATVADTTLATTISGNSTININQPGSNGAATYNLGTLSLGANLTITEPTTGNYYYGQPKINFTATTLTANSTLTETGGTAGGTMTTSLGPITGAYTLTTAGTNVPINILAGSGGNYAGLTVGNSNGVTINDAGGVPTTSLTLTGTGALTLYAPTGTTVNHTSLATTVSGASTININQPAANGGATYNLGTLSLGANLSIVEPTTGDYYYGQPTVSFAGTTLASNVTLTETSGTAGGTMTVNLGPVTGAYTLTTAGTNATLNILAGTGGNYSGLAVGNTGGVKINDVGGLPTATLSMNGTGPLTLFAPAGTTVNDTTVATTISGASTININQVAASGDATYNLGILSLGANLTIAEPTTGDYYYGQPVVNFKGTTLTTNVTLSVTSGTTGGVATDSLGPITGAYTLTTAGSNALINLLPGTGAGYSGLAINNTGGVQITGSGGLPTATLALNGTGALNLNAPSGTVVTDTTMATTVSGNSTINLNQAGSNGGATYSLGTLSLGANLSLVETNPAVYYFGQPTLSFGATTLTANSVITTTGTNAGLTFNPKMGPVTGVGFGITKSGAANLTLIGSSSYSGATVITAGTLYAGAINSLSPNSAVNISGGTLDTSAYADTIASLTVGSTGTLNLGIGNLLTSSGVASLAGTLGLSGSTTAASVELLAYSSYTGTFASSTGIPTGYQLVYTPTQLDLNVISTGPATLTWNNAGGNPANGTTWDIATNQNFHNGSSPSVYHEGDIVNFTDNNNGTTPPSSPIGTNPSAYSVTLNTTVHPTSVTVATAGAYSITGTGGIADVTSGHTPLTLSGTGSLVLGGSNTYTGGTTVGTGSDSPTLILSGKTAFPVASVLTVNSGAKVNLAAHTGNSSNVAVVTANTLTNSGLIDITNNDLIVRGSTLSTINPQIVSGYSGGTWTGTTGIISSTAQTNFLTTVGEIQATAAGTLDGATVASGDILLKYTYYGDTNLDGAVDGSDYTNIDNGFHNHLTGWANGDLNYDGVVDGSDYTLIDNAYNTQGSTLGTNPAELIAANTSQIAGGSSAVPEPTAFGLLGMAAASLLGRRSRRSK